jgi:hypothetical protein
MLFIPVHFLVDGFNPAVGLTQPGSMRVPCVTCPKPRVVGGEASTLPDDRSRRQRRQGGVRGFERRLEWILFPLRGVALVGRVDEIDPKQEEGEVRPDGRWPSATLLSSLTHGDTSGRSGLRARAGYAFATEEIEKKRFSYIPFDAQSGLSGND